MNIQAFDRVEFRNMVCEDGGRIITTSMKVAEFFGKQHKHVLEKIRRLDCSDEFLTANFSTVKFNHRGNEYEAYEMTKNGFIFLVMGFTGKKAARIKEAYINAFDWMTEQLQQQVFSITAELNAASLAYTQAEIGASSCGRGLRQWRDTKPELERRIDELKALAQLPIKFH